MFAFARQLAGAEEPMYGSSAIRPVGLQTGIVPYTELVREDLKWQAMTSSSVETQTFYITTEDDHIIMIQASYGNVA